MYIHPDEWHCLPSHVGLSSSAQGGREGKGLGWVNSIRALRRSLPSVNGNGKQANDLQATYRRMLIIG